MCGRLACTLCPEEISKRCQYKDRKEELEEPKWMESCYEYKPTYNGPPTATIPVLLNKQKFLTDNKENLPDRCLIPMRWGMLIDNKKSDKKIFHTHNARLENVVQSPLYRSCLAAGNRCVVLANGYYEWQTTSKDKQPYYIYQKPNPEDEDDKYLMKFAALFNKTTCENSGSIQYSCSILTTEADEEMSWMHHRVPVVLNTDEEVERWLNANSCDVVKTLPKYSQFANNYKFIHHAVNKEYVNKTSINDVKCMQRVTNKRKSTTLDSWLKKSKK